MIKGILFLVFADLFFIYFFLPVCLIFYFMTRNLHIRNAVLIVFSLVFYAWGEPVWVCLLVFSAVVDYINGLVIEKNRGKTPARLAVVCSLVINLGLLVAFKYSGFIVENVNNLVDNAQMSLNEIDRRIAGLEGESRRLPDKQQQLLNYQRNFKFS